MLNTVMISDRSATTLFFHYFLQSYRRGIQVFRIYYFVRVSSNSILAKTSIGIQLLVISVIFNHKMLPKDHNIRIMSSLQVSSDLFDFDKSSHKLWGSMWHSWTKPLIWGLPIERRFYTSSIWSILYRHDGKLWQQS